MGRGSDATRLERLELLQAHLRSSEAWTVGELASRLGTSTRTTQRDLDLLRERGLPIEAERGRGGGVRLRHEWSAGRLTLSYAEAVDLLVSLSVAEQMRSPLLMAHLEGVRRKLMASFTSTMRKRVRSLKARILVGPSVSPHILQGSERPKRVVTEALHQAFLAQASLRITYSALDGAKTRRVIQPHYLMLCYPVWYVLAWDELRDDVRTFRCDRIKRAQRSDETFSLLPPERFREAFQDIPLS